MRKGKTHLAKTVQREGWAGWRFMDDPWEAECGTQSEMIRLSSFPSDVTCAICLRRTKANKDLIGDMTGG